LTLQDTRFGDIEYNDLDVITFAEGLVGFPATTEFVLLCPREDKPFRWLQSTQEPDLAFLVTDPAVYVANYAPQVSDSVARSLAMTTETPRLVYTTVNIPRGRPDQMSINLAGPILINAADRKGKQIVLEDGAYTTKHRVFQKADQESADEAA
jgi:flagellar assembly factor FliW